MALRLSRCPPSRLQCVTRSNHRRMYSTPQTPQRAMITTPIFYVNGPPHIGHMYSAVLADAVSRWHRVRGGSSFLLTGTDEHGAKVAEAAKKAGLQNLDFCNGISSGFRSFFDGIGIKYDRFIRTTDADHIVAVQSLWKRLADKGLIYKGQYSGWYSLSDEAMLTETQVTDKIDATGKQVKVSIESGHKVEWVTEENYLFRLSAFQDRLLVWLKQSDVLQPHIRRTEIEAFITRGLTDLSVSRKREKVAWGIPVPGDEDHTVYVWLDALTNYITAAGFPNDVKRMEELWPAACQIIGKDITRFHAIYWPAFLMGADLPLPRRIVSHAHWTSNGAKMSKSLGNIVDPIAETAKHGLDPMRHFLLAEGGVEHDADFSSNAVTLNTHHVLADLYGNLVSRALAPSLNPLGRMPPLGPLESGDEELVTKLRTLGDRIDPFFCNADFRGGLKLVRQVLEDSNLYIARMEPWKLRKQPAKQQRVDTIMHITTEAVRLCSLALQPVIPESASRVLDWLCVPPSHRCGKQAFEFSSLPAQHPLKPASTVLFAKAKPPAAAAASKQPPKVKK